MSLLEKYVERIKQKTEGYSELEKIDRKIDERLTSSIL